MDTLKYVKVLEAAVHKMAEQLTTDCHGVPWIVNHYIKEGINDVEGRKNMKVMISQPMNGVPDSEVRRIQNELKERFAKYHIEVVDSFLTEEADINLRNKGVFYLGRTIQKFLSDVDAVYFVNGWQRARGCKIERQICEEYGIMILDDSFFKQENEVHIKRQFGTDKIQIMPCKSENQKYGVEMWSGTTPDIYNHIPRIDGMEEE